MECIGELLDRYIAAADSEENIDMRKYWENSDEWFPNERWRGCSAKKTDIPFTMAMDISGYAEVVGINCPEYFQNAHTHLRDQLRYALWEFEHIACRRYFEKSVFIGMGSVMEASFFDVPIHYPRGQAPWFDEQVHVMDDKTALLRVKPFDFYSSGLCARIHEFYETFNKLTQGYDVKVMFPLAMRGPFSIAIMLRGFNNLLMDIYDDPAFFHDLMLTITEYLKEYAIRRAKFLGEPIAQGMLFNDEISSEIISKNVYEEMILPYEIEMSRHTGGTRYWHSCGATHGFYELISTIPGLKLMHVGPWSDYAKAARIFGEKDISIEICLNSNRDMYDKTRDEMTSQLNMIKNSCEGFVKYSVRCDGIAVLKDIPHTLLKISEWKNAASEIFPH